MTFRIQKDTDLLKGRGVSRYPLQMKHVSWASLARNTQTRRPLYGWKHRVCPTGLAESARCMALRT